MNQWAAMGLVLAFGLSSPIQPGSRAQALFIQFEKKTALTDLNAVVASESLAAREKIRKIFATTSSEGDALALWRKYSKRW
ncbi:MAG TPA: hypothetical protein DD435_15800 [Cyanobacteria bacterium UBA8530]|nr:hypothetical protein [Cyanobacteria bacterium UBA8530]